MITIGIRAAPKEVTFAIYDAAAHRVINVEKVVIPAAFETPDALKYLRSNLLDILREYKVNKAGIRACEPNSQNLDIKRIQIEGVIQETFASSLLENYYVGHISSISSRVGIPRTDFKLMVSGEKNFDLEGWKSLSTIEREAILSAVGAVNA